MARRFLTAFTVAAFMAVGGTPASAQVATDVSDLASTLWASRPDGAFGPELSGTGLRLGMPVAEAVDLVQSRIPVAATIRRTGHTQVAGLQPLDITMFVTADGSDGFGLAEHPAVPGRLAGVTRSTIVDPNVLSAQQIQRALTTVYGEPFVAGSSSQGWLVSEFDFAREQGFTVPCIGRNWPVTQGQSFDNDVYDEEEIAALREVEWVEVAHLSDPLAVVWPGINDHAADWMCPTTVYASFYTDRGGLRFTLSIYDTAWVHDAAIRSRLDNQGDGAQLLSAITGVNEEAPTEDGADMLSDLLGVAPAEVFAAEVVGLDDAIAAIEDGRYDEAAEILIPLAEHGDAASIGLLAELVYDGGIRPGQNSYQLHRLARFAAPGNDPRAVFFQGVTTPVTDEAEIRRGLDLVIASAEAGYVKAQTYLAHAYHEGRRQTYGGSGTSHPQDEALALQWAVQAAENGDAQAQFLAGGYYFEGKGTEPDLEEATKWLELAQNQGVSGAQRLLTRVNRTIADNEAREQREAERERQAELRREVAEAAEAEAALDTAARPSGPQPASGSGEPTEAEMRIAIQARFDSLNQGMESTAQACRAGNFQNDPLLAMQCLSMGASTGDFSLETAPTVQLSNFEKLGCRESTTQPGYVCDYVLGMGSAGMRSLGSLGNLMAAGSISQGRFLRQGSGWLFLPNN